jgi:hypothetical protein
MTALSWEPLADCLTGGPWVTVTGRFHTAHFAQPDDYPAYTY